MEHGSSFQPENLRIFSSEFRTLSSAFPQEKAGESSKKSKKFRREYCFHFPSISRVFLQDPVTFPPLSGGIHSFPEARIIDLGIL
jgi:hypothetical protein